MGEIRPGDALKINPSERAEKKSWVFPKISVIFPKIICLFENSNFFGEWAELLEVFLAKYFGLAVAVGSGETEKNRDQSSLRVKRNGVQIQSQGTKQSYTDTIEDFDSRSNSDGHEG